MHAHQPTKQTDVRGSRLPSGLRPGVIGAAVTVVVSLAVGAVWALPASPQNPEPTPAATERTEESERTEEPGQDDAPPVDPADVESSLAKLRQMARSVRERHQAEVAAMLEAARIAEEARRAEEARLAEERARAEAAAQAKAAEAARRAEAQRAAEATAAASPAPAAPAVPAGSTWDRLAQCESGGNWSINTGNGYYGGLQFSASSWAAVGGSGLPHQHSREVQIEMGERLRARQGWGAWPHCSRKLGLR